MKFFGQDNYFGRINFVDENNVALGYDYGSSCCESFGYFLSNSMPINDQNRNFPVENEKDFNLEPYRFDVNFHEYLEVSDKYEYGGMMVFKLVDPTGENPDLFLAIFNYHNGYYGHGFTFTGEDGKIIEDSSL